MTRISPVSKKRFTILVTYMTIDVLVLQLLSVLAELSLLYDILDLYIYNHEMR